ncbi:hypothetical protein [Paludibacterium denitrificans]|uniref:hypothetical protein n=1 Tax=Paludibacterium denitrificans TaxID=2675226 RepID=UPI0035E3FF48
MAQSFEAQHPGSKIHLNFGASGALLQQMSKGATRRCVRLGRKGRWSRQARV